MARAPSQEQIRILGELARGEAPMQEDQVLSKMPDWSRFESAGLLPSGSTTFFQNLHELPLSEKGAEIVSNAENASRVLRALEITSDIQPIQYMLTLLYEILRDDASMYDSLLRIWANEDVVSPFIGVLDNQHSDGYACDKAAFVLSGLICRAPIDGLLSESKVEYFVHAVAKGKYNLSRAGCLEVVRNILKNGAYRKIVWDTRHLIQLISENLTAQKSVACAYQAAFCVWLFSFERDFAEPLHKSGLVDGLCNLLKEAKAEKIVRVCLLALQNLLQNDNCVETVINRDVSNTLTVLEFEKWRDEELYTVIRETNNSLNQKIKQFSNFDRYCRELEKNRLTWSFLHSEKFWRENVIHFEEAEFAAVKKIASLLRSPDPTTLAVACHDLGEFARLYPTGKQVVQKLEVKGKVMELMSNSNRSVSREALLCTQKLMLDKWQEAAGAGSQAVRVQ